MTRHPQPVIRAWLAQAQAQRPRHAVSYARGANGKAMVACTCGWATGTSMARADQAARDHLLAAR